MRKSYYMLPIGIISIAIIGIVVLRSENFFSKSKALPKQDSNSDKTLNDYYTESQALTPREAENKTATFLAVGDISLSRNIAQTIKTSGNILKPFAGIEELLNSTDFNFGNLETPFSKSDAFTPKNTLTFNAPKANAQGLTQYNFKVLNLANNHAFDQGVDGVTTTARILNEQGLLHMGTGLTLDGAWQPAIMETQGIRIGFIGASYSSINDGGKATNPYVARIEDTERLRTQILQLKSTVDFIVVTMHAGTEYTRKPNQNQIDFAHSAIESGADLVIGAHPHWIQTIEEYQGKRIFYSLGNFIFDQNWSQETQEGLALKITLEKRSTLPIKGAAGTEDLQGNRIAATIKEIQLIPIIIEENCCPRPALSVEAQKILEKIDVFESVLY